MISFLIRRRLGVVSVTILAICTLSRADVVDAYEQSCRNFDGRPLLTFENLKDFIKDNQVRSQRDLVAALGKNRETAPFLDSYVLIHSSRSAQRHAASKEFPRVVFFQRGLILGVTDYPGKDNSRVEVMQYSPQSNRFHFRLIRFNGGEPQYEENPTSCLRCHGNKPLPIWPTYRTWPGAYGSRSDFLYVENPEKTAMDPKKLKELQDWLYDRRATQKLSIADKEKAEWIESLFRPVKRKMEGVYTHLGEDSPREDLAAFNGYLNQLNFRRIANELEASKDFDRYRYAFLGALFRCPDVPSFLGEKGSPVRDAHDAPWKEVTLATLVDEVRHDVTDEFKRRLDFAKEIKDEVAMTELQMSDEEDIEPIATMRYLLEKRGVDVKRFSHNFHPGDSHGYGFSEVGAGTGGLRFSYCYFIPPSVRADATLAPLLEFAPHGSIPYKTSEQKYCGFLKEKSLEAFR